MKRLVWDPGGHRVGFPQPAMAAQRHRCANPLQDTWQVWSDNLSFVVEGGFYMILLLLTGFN